MPVQKVVHILIAGRALCGRLGLPYTWAAGEVWIDRKDAERDPKTVTCYECTTRLSSLKWEEGRRHE